MIVNFTDRFSGAPDISPMGYAVLCVCLMGLAWLVAGA